MKFRFITALYNLKLTSIKNRGIEIIPGWRISNGSRVLEETLDTDLMRSTAGIHSIDEIKASTYCYIDGEYDEIQNKDQMDQHGVRFTFYYLREVQRLLHHLWEIKDNNVYVRDGFLITYTSNFEDGRTYKASLSEIYSLANRENKETVCSDDDLGAAISRFTPVSIEVYGETSYGGKNPNSNHLYKGNSERIGRAIYYTGWARKSSILPMKILAYCTAIECLFTTTTAELSHRASERVAVLLGTSEESMKKLYNLVKEVYNVRSKIVHGQYLTGSEERLIELSVGIDEVLRQLIVAEHEIFAKNDKDIDEFFINLLFNRPL